MGQKRRLTGEQIVGVVKQLEAGRTAAEMAREVGVSTYTIYSWKAQFGGLEPNEATKLRHVEEESGRLKKLVAELALDKEMLKARRRVQAVRHRTFPGFRPITAPDIVGSAARQQIESLAVRRDDDLATAGSACGTVHPP